MAAKKKPTKRVVFGTDEYGNPVKFEVTPDEYERLSKPFTTENKTPVGQPIKLTPYTTNVHSDFFNKSDSPYTQPPFNCRCDVNFNVEHLVESFDEVLSQTRQHAMAWDEYLLKRMLQLWVSECEPVIVFDNDNMLIGLALSSIDTLHQEDYTDYDEAVQLVVCIEDLWHLHSPFLKGQTYATSRSSF